VWFVDSDCVAADDALQLLLPHLEDPTVGAASGAYDNAVEGSLVATLINEEIAARHRAMPQHTAMRRRRLHTQHRTAPRRTAQRRAPRHITQHRGVLRIAARRGT